MFPPSSPSHPAGKRRRTGLRRWASRVLAEREASSFRLHPSSFSSMPTYIYETTDPKEPVRRFEVRQSMKDAPLTKDPETGEPVRRVISGGLGYMITFTAPKHPDMRPEMG